MSNDNAKKNSGGFYNLLKTLFLLFIILQFVPTIFTNLKEYVQDAVKPKSQVGTLNIKGFIGDSSFYVKHIQNFLKDPQIKALFLKIDSSGGFPGTSQTIYNELKIFKKEKPVISFVENVCTSGAYYVAAASNYIVTSGSAGVGGIGVLANLPNIKGFLDNWNIQLKHIQTGKYKTTGSPFKEPIPEELEYLQRLSDEHYDQFIKDIAQSRNLDVTKHEKWADGKMFMGNTALKLKLIDQVGSQQTAIEQIKKLAEITTEIKFIAPKKPSGLMSLFSSEDDYELQDNSFSGMVANTLNNISIKFMEKQMEHKQSLVYG